LTGLLYGGWRSRRCIIEALEGIVRAQVTNGRTTRRWEGGAGYCPIECAAFAQNGEYTANECFDEGIAIADGLDERYPG